MFNSTINNLNSQIESSQNAIASLEAQLQEERENLKQLETHKQAFVTAASAAQSAKEQVMVAIQLLGTVAPENLSELQTELNSLFDAYSQSILAESTTDTDSQDDAVKGDVNIADVEVITSMDNESTPEADIALNDSAMSNKSTSEQDHHIAKTFDGEDSQPLSYKDLMQEDYEILKAIAKDLNLPNGSKAKVSSGLAKAKITRRTIAEKLAEFTADIGG